MPRNPLDSDIRVMIPRRSVAAWNRVAAQLAPLLKSVGREPTNSNLAAAMIEVLDGLNNPNFIPSGSPHSPITEWPDGSGITITGGRVGRRRQPGESPTKGRDDPIRPAPKAARKAPDAA